ncbi:hypothetical protein PGTUg99_010224 [Puccinia graminis f. sp. tritici]|uniref:Uncharacterized protein n=1 Tax=Puccinia graminis f. sp. tritici TaxID=56615 RepID=A0A5B0QKW2_PUCGR|nr:hypothetical protein PGTUg99_010224 [Puccinia graminis f. sp. tritici]
MSSETFGLIAQEFDDLVARCWKIDDNQSPIVPAKSFSTDDIDVGKAHLLQIQTSFLPSLRQQLAGLMASLKPGALEKDPIAKCTHTLEIIQKIGHILNQINASVNSFVSMPPDEGKKDQDYGVLKKFRCHALAEKINSLIGGKLRQLFLHYSVFIRCWEFPNDLPTFCSDDKSHRVELEERTLEITALSLQGIDSIIEWSNRSDFGILQDAWIPQVRSLSSNLAMVTRRLNPTVHPREEHDTTGGSPPGSTNSSGARENNQGDGRDDRSEADVSSAHEEDQSRNNPEISLTPHQVELIQQTIPIIKLSRIFFNKMISTRKGKPPFTLNSQISSADIASLQEEMVQISVCIADIVDLLCNANSPENLDRDTVELLPRWIQELSGHFDSALIMLGFHLVSTTSHPDPPQHESFFKTGFYSLRSQFRVALNNLVVSLHKHVPPSM